MAYLTCFIACKKTHTSPPTTNDFLKVYNVHLWSTNLANFALTGSIATDNDGNNYFWFYDSIASPNLRLAIVKTNKTGDLIWKKNYFLNVPGNSNPNLSLPVYKNFICGDQYLYLLGSDTSSANCLFKLNCVDGNTNSRITFDNILPPNTFVNSIWPASDGNILLICSKLNIYNYASPGLSLITTSGTQLWSWFQLPYATSHTSETANAITELKDGSFMFGTLYVNKKDTLAGQFSETRTLKFYHISNSGSLSGTNAINGGTDLSNNMGGLYAYDSIDAIRSYYLFSNTAGGYNIISTAAYKNDSRYLNRIKLLKTDDSFRVTSTGYINPPPGNSVLSSVVQKTDGTILASVFNDGAPQILYSCSLYNIAPDGSSTAINDLPLSYQSIFITDISQAKDGHLLFTGVLQTYATDTNNVFLMKTDNNLHL